ncbi:MAG: 2-C-methyl-D-erythritol 2,4-cyclodiphosphate synthase [Bacilli bacterium]|jgi:2-C-methyl-D-erythritol 2,4-cyclodiphosphate synthase|nr:2-C-methyl-D-erythritol 2,4-cyclodiphosphate synthase [Bacilli bacterium]
MLKIGSSMDIHPLVKGRKLILGGITIESEYGCYAHSDGDVLLHSIIEAIIGALGKGDLGEHFPDSDDKYKDIDSSILLNNILGIMKKEHYVINNLDCSIILEKPKLGKHKEKIRQNVARLLSINEANVNIKAGTMEGIGEIGKNEAVMAFCSILLESED